MYNFSPLNLLRFTIPLLLFLLHTPNLAASCGGGAIVCATSPDGNNVACGGQALTCMASPNGRNVACGGQSLTCMASPDGRNVACGGQALTCMASPDGHNVACGGQALTCMASPDGKNVACGGQSLTCMTSPDGKKVACGGASLTLNVANEPSPENTQIAQRTLDFIEPILEASQSPKLNFWQWSWYLARSSTPKEVPAPEFFGLTFEEAVEPTHLSTWTSHLKKKPTWLEESGLSFLNK